MARKAVLSGGRKRVLVVLFLPSVERDGITPIDQPRWVDASLEMFGQVFGGATAYPKAMGIWRDDARGGALIRDEPVASTVIRLRRTLKMKAISRSSAVSVAGWDVRPGKAKLVS